MDDDVARRRGRGHGGGIVHVREYLLAGERGAAVPLQGDDLVPVRRERRARRPAEQARATGHEHAHQTRLGAGPPASRASAKRPSLARSIFELWRMSTGNDGTERTAATACPARASRTERSVSA